jgi:hypothetical protein
MHGLYHILNLSSPFEFQASKKYQNGIFQGDIILCGLYQYLLVIPSLLGSPSLHQNQSSFSKYMILWCSVLFCKPDCPILESRLVRPFSLDSSKDCRSCSVNLPDMSDLSKLFVSSKIFTIG